MYHFSCRSEMRARGILIFFKILAGFAIVYAVYYSLTLRLHAEFKIKKHIHYHTDILDANVIFSFT